MNTATKRFSALLVTLPFRLVLPIPDGAVDSTDRPIVPYQYALSGGQQFPSVGWVAGYPHAAFVMGKRVSVSIAEPLQSAWVEMQERGL